MAQSLGSIVQSIWGPLFKKNPQLTLMLDWPLIVGQEIALVTWPVKILTTPQTGPVLYIYVSEGHEMSSWAMSYTLMERVNQHLGYQGVSRLRWMKKPLSFGEKF